MEGEWSMRYLRIKMFVIILMGEEKNMFRVLEPRIINFMVFSFIQRKMDMIEIQTMFILIGLMQFKLRNH